MAKSIKVKSLADKYSGATSTGVVEVLQELGINNVPISGTVPQKKRNESKRISLKFLVRQNRVVKKKPKRHQKRQRRQK